LVEHDELEGVAPGVTAEAVEKLHLRVDGEGGGLLVVERAEPLQPRTGRLEGDVIRNQANDVTCVPDRRDELSRERYGQAGHLPSTGRDDRGRPGPKEGLIRCSYVPAPTA